MRAALIIMALLLPGMAAAQVIVAAQYTDAADRYGHRVLRTGGEWGAMVLDLDDGRTRRVTLPDTLVFEDIAPASPRRRISARATAGSRPWGPPIWMATDIWKSPMSSARI